MIGYCGGLPLAIIVLGGLLAAKQTQDEWGDVLGRIESYHHVEQNLRVNKVLALSYYDLPCHLKPCFLYLGHFPEDFEIPTRKLIRMLMGEGFISQIQHEREREDTMDDVGDRYLRELVQRCMVLVGKSGLHGRIKTCRMHDLMWDFCVSKAQEENFLHFTNILSMKQCEVQIGKVRRLAIIPKSGDNYIEGVKFKEYPYLSYLQSLVSVDPKTIQIPTWFKLSRLQLLKVRINKQAQDATQILQILISRCPHLEKLNIFKPIKKLPEAHQFSPYLFKLILWGTNLEADPMATLEKLPNLKLLRLFGSFFQMKNMACSERGFLVLQTLVIGFCDNLEQWRVEEGAMPSLSHLTIDSCQSLKTIPDELRFITTLKELEIKHMPKSFKDRLHEGGPDFYKVQHVQRMDPVRILFMEYSFRIIHGATTKSEAKVDSVLKNK
uniref:Disease resistance protein winged helix domain-containing protein n=1 Tax=Quercus lobata TaxID=97700 RepID=A0A7N2MYV6_QUELO